ncbi:MAG TPA: dephospho-CoA kinase [Gammaproteobacteria bacterium]|nr:dephospho-CoA kinase [Gammaproteobacteria bacterium]
MLKVGLTGGIASGKSTVAAAFARLGVPVVDADAISHALTAPGQAGLAALHAALGDAVLDAQGSLDRARLRHRLFNDPALRARVQALLHPLIIAELARQLEAATGPYGLAVVPLLVETPAARSLMDRVLVVDCPEQLQLSRLMLRDNENEADARAMLAAQSDRARRLVAGDDILVNAGGLTQLRAAVERLHAFYLELAAQRDYRRAGLRLP